MKRILTAAALALLASTAAQADNTTRLYAGGAWATDHIAQNGDGKPMCLVSASWTFPGNIKGQLMMKFSNELGVFLHISKSNWQFESGRSVPMSIMFDTGVRNGSGTTMKLPQAGGDMVQSDVPAERAAGFLEDFANAKIITIIFRDGNETPWRADMTGSRDAVKAFASCMGRITTVATTSPLAPKATTVAPPSQPVGNRTKDDGSI